MSFVQSTWTCFHAFLLSTPFPQKQASLFYYSPVSRKQPEMFLHISAREEGKLQTVISAVCPRLWWISSTRAWGTWSSSGRTMRNQSQVFKKKHKASFTLLQGSHKVTPKNSPRTVTWRCVCVSPVQPWPSLERPILTRSQRWERMPLCPQSPESSVSFTRIQVNVDLRPARSQGGLPGPWWCVLIYVCVAPGDNLTFLQMHLFFGREFYY